MKAVWIVPVIVSILILGTIGIASNAYAGTIDVTPNSHVGCPPECGGGDGIIVSINPPGNHGMIERTDNGSNDKYQFRIPEDLQDSSYSPEVGDNVCFGFDPIHSRHAIIVKEISDCSGGSGGI